MGVLEEVRMVKMVRTVRMENPVFRGKPGAEVTIIKGVPNVIALYSQQEFGEYVRTTDGGVAYRVYDESGNKV